MSKKIIIGIAIVVLIILIATIKNPSNTTPIKLGFVGPLSGGQALWGDGARNMMQLAVDEINSNDGIDGRQISAFYQDGKGTPKGALSAVQQLLQSEVQIIIGGHSSPETSGIVDSSKDGSFFMIAGVTSSDNAMANSKFAFRTSPPTIDFAKQLVGIAKSKYNKIVTLTEVAAFSKSYTDNIVKLFTDAGGVVIDQQSYQPDVTDFRSILTKIKSEKPDALFISPQSPTTASAIAKQMHELGLNIPVFGNSILVTNSVFTNSNNSPSLINAFSIIPYTDQNTDKSKILSQKYQSKFSTPVPYNFFYVSATYDAVYMVKEAIQSCNNTEPKCISDYFRKINYSGVSSDYTFKDNGDSNFDSWALITLDKNGKEVITPITN